MESGQVHLDDRIRGVYAYYFLVDPDSPTAPVPSRQRRYIIGTSVESYVEAFFGLVLHLNRNALAAAKAAEMLPPPPSANVSTIGDISAVPGAPGGNADATTAGGVNAGNQPPPSTTSRNVAATTAELLRPWSHLYCSAFGQLAFDTFCRRVNAADATFLFCELNEEQARIRAAALANPTGASWGQTSTRAVSPQRPKNGAGASGSGVSPYPATVSPYRNGSRLKGLGTAFAYEAQDPQPMSAISGNASSRLRELQNTVDRREREAAGLNSSSSGGHHHHRSNATVHFASGLERDGGEGSTEAHLAHLKNQVEGTTNALLIERSRAVVQNLSDAERNALVYKYETTRKELDEERKRTSNLRETLRITMSDFEERLERLQQSSANALSEAAARERHNLDSLDKELSTKFKAERDQLELNLLEKDRKLAKALARVEFLEGQCDALTKKSDLLATEEQRAAAFCVKAKAEQERLEDECNRLRRSLAHVESRLDDETRLRRNTEVAYRSLEQHSNAVKGENDKLRRDCEKFAQYSLSLHEELKALDANAIAASEMFGPRRLLQQQQAHQAQQQMMIRRPSFPQGYGM